MTTPGYAQQAINACSTLNPQDREGSEGRMYFSDYCEQ